MHASQLPVDDRFPGLAERPGAYVVPAAADMSSATLFRDGEAASDLSDRERAALAQQLEMACRHGVIVERVALRHGMLPSIIAGFCSRRSGWGLDLNPIGIDGTRDLQARPTNISCRETSLPPDALGFLRGLMGLDFDRHPMAREGPWRDPESNIDAAFAIIAGYRRRLRRSTTLQGTGLLRASLTAFESGIERVEAAIRQGRDVDSPTPGWCQIAGRGCGQDVMVRAGFFHAEGWD